MGTDRPVRSIRFRLLHDGVQPGPPLPEPLYFGVQDTKGGILSGKPGDGWRLIFDITLDVTEGKDGAPMFRGPFAHGPPTARFLYLSWKRHGAAVHPWGWRLKLPLAGVGWGQIGEAEMPGFCILASVVGRRPHSSQPVAWSLGRIASDEENL